MRHRVIGKIRVLSVLMAISGLAAAAGGQSAPESKAAVSAARHEGRDRQTLPRNGAGARGPEDIAAAGSAKIGGIDMLRRGDSTRMEIALTFDDGPHPPFTQHLLDLLKQLNVHATFFVVGAKVDEAPELLRRMIHEGHEIGNHTYHHFNLKEVPVELTDCEIRMDNDAIRRACGAQPLFFRPSGGQFNANVRLASRHLHMIMALWTDDPGDYDPDMSSAIIETRLLNHIRPGAIVLLHDGMPQTYDMLPDFVARMRRDGYRFVTLTEMLQDLEAGRIVHP